MSGAGGEGEPRSTRRQFLRQAAIGVCSAAGAAKLAWARPDERHDIPRRPLGRTGEKVSILGLGGWHLGSMQDENQAIRLVREAVDMGVTFLDNAWCYHRGRSEELAGRALRDGYRQKVFLMTKHHGRRDRKTAMLHLEDSLRRLQTDVIDLWQFHEIIHEDDPDMIFSEGGALEAAREARKAGKVRYIGFTGHKGPGPFLDMLGRDQPWDAVQMPVNVLDAQFASFQKAVLPLLVERGIGVIAMKALCAGTVIEKNLFSAEEALRYAWSQPVATIVSGIDSREILLANAGHARDFRPMSAGEQQRLLERTREMALSGRYEPYKTTRGYDSRIGREQDSPK